MTFHRWTSRPVLVALCALGVALSSASRVEAQPFAGTVVAHKKISATQGGLPANLTAPGLFGVSVTDLGDLDGDGTRDRMIGAYVDNEYGAYTGAVYTLFMKPDGTVKSFVKIGSQHGGFNVTLDPLDMFGWSVENMGDLDLDGVTDVAVGSWLDDEGATHDQGAIYILFMKKTGDVKSWQKITAGVGGFSATLYSETRFGTSLTNLGDLNGDGVNDLLAGAIYDNDAAYIAGAAYVLFLRKNGEVRSHVKIGMGQGGFFTVLDHQDRFGYASTNLGDLDGDGVTDVAISSFLDNDAGLGHGAVYILFMQKDGFVKSHTKITEGFAGFEGPLAKDDSFGASLACIPDLNGDGCVELAVGTIGDDTGGNLRGAVWVLFLSPDGTVHGRWKIGSNLGGFTGTLHDDDRFGQSVCYLGDLDGDGTQELAIGADHDDDGGQDAGAVWTVSLAPSAWTDMGRASKSATPPPVLLGAGTAKPGSSFTINLEGGIPSTPAILMIGAKEKNTPIYGTLLVPELAPPSLTSLLSFPANGKISIPATWPMSASIGTTIYLQALATGVSGSGNPIVLSNGVRAITH